MIDLLCIEMVAGYLVLFGSGEKNQKKRKLNGKKIMKRKKKRKEIYRMIMNGRFQVWKALISAYFCTM